MKSYESHGPEETAALGEAFGRDVPAGTVIALTGDLGAGKTQLVKGLALGLGVADRVHSPTFAIVNTYEGGRLPLAHLDLYRLETPEDLIAAGVGEFLEPEGVAVIEWAEKLFVSGPAGSPPLISRDKIPANLRQISIEVVDEETRRINHDDARH